MTAASLPRWMAASGALDPDIFDDEEHQPYDRAQLPHRCPGVLCCPHCHSVRVAQSHRGHKPAALLGAVAGLYAVSCGTQHRQWLHPCGQRVPMIGG